MLFRQDPCDNSALVLKGYPVQIFRIIIIIIYYYFYYYTYYNQKGIGARTRDKGNLAQFHKLDLHAVHLARSKRSSVQNGCGI